MRHIILLRFRRGTAPLWGPHLRMIGAAQLAWFARAAGIGAAAFGRHWRASIDHLLGNRQVGLGASDERPQLWIGFVNDVGYLLDYVF